MLLNKFLSEDTLSGQSINNNVPDIEMSNEGFRMEDGGAIRAIMLAEDATTELNMICQNSESNSMKMMVAGNLSEAYVLQENVITSALGGIKKIIMKLWARMKEVCHSLKLQFEKLFNKSAFLKDAEKTLKNMTDFKDLEFEGYVYSYNTSANDIYKAGAKVVDDLFGKAESALNPLTAATSTEATAAKLEAIKDKLNALKGTELEKSLSQAAFKCDTDKINAELFKKFRSGKDSKEKLTFSKEKCLTAIKQLSTLANAVNSVQQDVDTNHKTAISEVDKLIKDAEKSNNDALDVARPITTAKLALLRDKANALKSALTLANLTTNAHNQALKDEASQSRNFLMAAIRQGSKNAKAANVNASTDIAGAFDSLVDQY